MNSPSRPTRVRWFIFVLACAASWLLYLHRYAWGVVKPFYKAENPGISDVDLGWLDSAFLATYAIGGFAARARYSLESSRGRTFGNHAVMISQE